MTRHDDLERFTNLLTGMAAVYGIPTTPAWFHAYWQVLQGLPIEDVALAVRRALAMSTFCPRPADLLRLLGLGLPDPGLVNALISQHVGTPGGDHTAPVDPFVALCVQRLGGIRRASDMTAADRLRALRDILPAVIPRALTEGMTLPTEAQVTNRHARRLLLEDGT